MDKRIMHLMLMFLLVQCAYCRQPEKSIFLTRADLKEQSEHMFRFKVKSGKLLKVLIKTPADAPYLRTLIKEEKFLLQHLAWHYLAEPLWGRFHNKPFTEKDGRNWLRDNQEFQEALLDLVFFYLQARGGGISDHVPANKRQVTRAELLSYGVRFFKPIAGKNSGYLCIAADNLEALTEPKFYPLEGMCFSALKRDRSAFSRLIKIWDETFQAALSQDQDNQRLARQKAALSLQETPLFLATLEKEYKRLEAYLPFFLVD